MTGSSGDADEEVQRQSRAVEDATAQINALVESVESGSGAGARVDEIYELDRTNDYLEQLDLEQDIDLKRRYANVLLWLLGLQLLAADSVFIAYAQVGAHWKLSASVIDVWLGATLVEVVGIVLVVTRYLFPRRDAQV